MISWILVSGFVFLTAGVYLRNQTCIKTREFDGREERFPKSDCMSGAAVLRGYQTCLTQGIMLTSDLSQVPICLCPESMVLDLRTLSNNVRSGHRLLGQDCQIWRMKKRLCISRGSWRWCMQPCTHGKRYMDRTRQTLQLRTRETFQCRTRYTLQFSRRIPGNGLKHHKPVITMYARIYYTRHFLCFVTTHASVRCVSTRPSTATLVPDSSISDNMNFNGKMIL
jgi:hypothetical protein